MPENPDFSYVIQDAIFDYNPNFEIGKSFSKNVKSEIFLRTALQSAPKCKICNGLLHQKSISIDHIIRKEDGGTGSIDKRARRDHGEYLPLRRHTGPQRFHGTGHHE